MHRSTHDLKAVILNDIETVNADPKSFRWTKSADDRLAAIQRFCLGNRKFAEDQKTISETPNSGHERSVRYR